MALDDIQAEKEEKRVKLDEKVSANSIKFKQDSLMNTIARAKELIKQREALVKELNEKVVTDVEKGLTNEQIIGGPNFKIAAKIATLENEINILVSIQGPVELTGNRAIRLIDKMIKTAKTNSSDIYSELYKKLEVKEQENVVEEPKTEVITTPVEEENALKEIPLVDIEKIVDENTNEANQNIQEAINNEEKIIADSDINDVVDESLSSIVSIPVVDEVKDEVSTEAVSKEDIDIEAKEQIINDKLYSFVNSEEKDSDYEYTPMTDEEVAASQEKLQFDKHNEINSEIERKNQEVAEVNAAKEFNFDGLFVTNSNNEVPLRDEVVTVPEREEEPVKEEIEEYSTVVEPRSMNMSSDAKEKVREYMEKVFAARKKKEELEKENSIVDSYIEDEKAKNSEIIAKEDAAKKTLEESTMEASKAEQDYVAAINAIEKELEDLNSETEVINNGIREKREQLASLQEDTANRNKEIENLDKENQSKQEEIAKYKELKEMLSIKDEEAQVQKAM